MTKVIGLPTISTVYGQTSVEHSASGECTVFHGSGHHVRAMEYAKSRYWTAREAELYRQAWDNWEKEIVAKLESLRENQPEG